MGNGPRVERRASVKQRDADGPRDVVMMDGEEPGRSRPERRRAQSHLHDVQKRVGPAIHGVGRRGGPVPCVNAVSPDAAMQYAPPHRPSEKEYCKYERSRHAWPRTVTALAPREQRDTAIRPMVR